MATTAATRYRGHRVQARLRPIVDSSTFSCFWSHCGRDTSCGRPHRWQHSIMRAPDGAVRRPIDAARVVDHRQSVEPTRRGADEMLVIFLLRSGWVTFREALVGFAAGGHQSEALGCCSSRQPAERGLMRGSLPSRPSPWWPSLRWWCCGRQGSSASLGGGRMPIAAFRLFPVTSTRPRASLRCPPPRTVPVYASTPRQ